MNREDRLLEGKAFDLIDDLTWVIIVYGLILYILRSAIDQQKGAIVEAAAIMIPIAMTAILYNLLARDTDQYGMGLAIGRACQYVFLSAPIVMAWRLIERLRISEKIQIADLFRITTITSLATFVFAQLEVTNEINRLPFLCVAYLIGDGLKSLYGQPQKKLLQYSSLFAIVAALVANVALQIAWMGFAIGYTPYLMSNMSYRRFTAALEIPYIAMLMGFMLATPWLMSWLFEPWHWFHKLGHWLACWRMKNGHPSEGMHHRPTIQLWHFRPGVRYMNHGSFGAVPVELRRAQRSWQRACEEEPLDILSRQTEPAWMASRDRLAKWLDAPSQCVAFSENATVAMNEVASTVQLEPGDEVVLNDHEYGAVKRIWKRRCAESGAVYREVTLPMPFSNPQAIVDAILAECNDKTKLVVFSHITSPTATILPVKQLCKALRARDIATCIDGPHAILQEQFSLTDLDCDFYAASCHKWLCAPLGSGMLYAHPRWHDRVRPLRLSWGRLPPAVPASWADELTWVGTRDYSPYLMIPKAIDYFEAFDREKLDQRNHQLACYAKRTLESLPGMQSVTPEEREWMGWMAAVWLPPQDFSWLQQTLWKKYRIEVPIMRLKDRWLVRVSCHLYNSTHDIDILSRSLATELHQSMKK